MRKISAYDGNFHVLKGITDYYFFQPKSFDIYRIDKSSYDILTKIENSNTDSADIQVPLEIKNLLDSDADNKSHGNMLKIISKKYRDTNPHVNSLNIYLSSGCNLSCTYCYTDDASTSKKARNNEIDLSTGYRAIDFYLESLEATGAPPAINFFGGEPLLYFGTIKKIAEYAVNHKICKNKKITFFTTTNATLLNNEMIDFFIKNNFKLVVSLDGNREINDRNRKFRNGEGSYELVWENLKKLVNACPDAVRIRATVCPSFTEVNSIVEHFRTSGAYRYGFELVYDTGANDENRWTDEKILEYKSNHMEYINSIYRLIVENKIKEAELSAILEELTRLKNRLPQYLPCQMGRESVTVAGDGFIYPCHWLVFSEKWRIGSLDRGFFSDRDKSYPDLVFENPVCRNCWARFLCGGGCPSISIRSNNSKSKPNKWMCMDKKIRWEGYIALYAELLKTDSPVLRRGELR